jgi:hypothetical protein
VYCVTESHRDAGTHPWFERVLAPILHDLRATCAASFEIRDARWEGQSISAGISFVICHSLGAETRVSVVASGKPWHDIADTADKVQDVATDALWFEGLSPLWPECPEHPGSHALLATVQSERPVWMCPANREVIAEIGTLADPSSQVDRPAR